MCCYWCVCVHLSCLVGRKSAARIYCMPKSDAKEAVVIVCSLICHLYFSKTIKISEKWWSLINDMQSNALGRNDVSDGSNKQCVCVVLCHRHTHTRTYSGPKTIFPIQWAIVFNAFQWVFLFKSNNILMRAEYFFFFNISYHRNAK